MSTQKMPDTAARERSSWYFYDFASSAFATVVLGVFLAPYLNSLADAAASAGQDIEVLWLVPVAPDTYFTAMMSISLVLAIIVNPIVGAVADIVRSKKQVMAVTSYIGATAVALMVFTGGTAYQAAGVLFVIANLCLALSTAVNNSYLPLICAPADRDLVSGRGYAMGYFGGALLLAVSMGVFTMRDALGLTDEGAIRVSLLLAGLWWAGFVLIPVLRLAPHSPANPVSSGLLRHALRQLRGMPAEIRSHPQSARFLLAFFMIGNGIVPTTGLTAAYAVEELELPTTTLIAAVGISLLSGIVGALVMARLAFRHGARQIIYVSLSGWLAAGVIIILLPSGNSLTFALAAVPIGFLLGGTQPLCRSLYSQFVARHRESEFFSFFEVTNSLCTVLVPLLFVVSFALLGSFRMVIAVPMAMIVIGGLLLRRVDVAQGMRDTREIEGRSTA